MTIFQPSPQLADFLTKASDRFVKGVDMQGNPVDRSEQAAEVFEDTTRLLETQRSQYVPCPNKKYFG